MDTIFDKNKQAIKYYELGDFCSAEQIFSEVINELRKQIEDSDETSLLLAGTLVNLGGCLQEQGDLSKSQEILREALGEYDLIKNRHSVRSYIARTMVNLGNCTLQDGDFFTAKTLYNEALVEYNFLIKQGNNDLLSEIAATRMNLGTCLEALCDYPKAKKFYEEAFNEYKNLLEQGYNQFIPDFARTCINLGTCSKALEDFSNCDKYYQMVLDLLKNNIEQIFPDAIKMIHIIIHWHFNHQRPDGPNHIQAFELSQLGLEWLDMVLKRISDKSKNFLLEQNIDLFHIAADLAIKFKEPNQAYFILERSKSRVLVEQILRENTEHGSHIDKNLRAKYHTLCEHLINKSAPESSYIIPDNLGKKKTLFFSQTFTNTNRNIDEEKQFSQERQKLEQKLAKIRNTIAEQDSAYAEAIQPRSLTVGNIATLIPPDSLGIAFEQRRDCLYLYPITTKGVGKQIRILIERKELQERVDIFNKNVIPCQFGNDKHVKEVEKISTWLTNKLRLVLNNFIIQNKPKKILFIPHQLWHLLPLHLIEINRKPLTFSYPVYYIPSLQVLRLIHEREPANNDNGCIIANPGDDLPDAQKIARIIKNNYRPLDILLEQKQANLNAVRQHLNNAEHAQMFCHGYFQPHLNSHLILADDDRLLAKELFTNIRLKNARIIILAVCESAQIQPTIADEYIGLASSFIFAGAHNVLAALWRVEVHPTLLLIEDFYQGLAKGLSPTIALQQAQNQLHSMSTKQILKRLEFLDEDTKEELEENFFGIESPYESPYYWAGFVLIGDGI
jgi:CHAT domain-containing protein/Tfp pilus assembly protein PilF